MAARYGLLDSQAEAELANCGLVAWAWRYRFFYNMILECLRTVWSGYSWPDGKLPGPYGRASGKKTHSDSPKKYRIQTRWDGRARPLFAMIFHEFHYAHVKEDVPCMYNMNIYTIFW